MGFITATCLEAALPWEKHLFACFQKSLQPRLLKEIKRWIAFTVQCNSLSFSGNRCVLTYTYYMLWNNVAYPSFLEEALYLGISDSFVSLLLQISISYLTHFLSLPMCSNEQNWAGNSKYKTTCLWHVNHQPEKKIIQDSSFTFSVSVTLPEAARGWSRYVGGAKLLPQSLHSLCWSPTGYVATSFALRLIEIHCALSPTPWPLARHLALKKIPALMLISSPLCLWARRMQTKRSSADC